MTNGFLSNITPEQMAMLGMAGGLLGASGYSARPISFGEAMGQGLLGGVGGYTTGLSLQDRQRKNQMEEEARQQEILTRQQFAELSKQAKSPEELMHLVSSSGNVNLLPYAKQIGEGIPKAKFLREVQGEGGKVLYQPFSEYGGEMQTGSMAAAKPLSFQDIGGQVAGINQYTGQPMAGITKTMTPGQAEQLAISRGNLGLRSQELGMRAKELSLQHDLKEMQLKAAQQRADPEYQKNLVAGKEVAKKQAMDTYQAQSALPYVMEKTSDNIRLLDELKEHPGREWATGFSSILPNVPGTSLAGFRKRHDEIMGKLYEEGVQMLRGTGQIAAAETEGMIKGMSRMDPNLPEEEYVKALNETMGYMVRGMNKVRRSAGLEPINANQARGYNAASQSEPIPTPANLPIPGSSSGGFDDGFGELIVR